MSENFVIDYMTKVIHRGIGMTHSDVYRRIDK